MYWQEHFLRKYDLEEIPLDVGHYVIVNRWDAVKCKGDLSNKVLDKIPL